MIGERIIWRVRKPNVIFHPDNEYVFYSVMYFTIKLIHDQIFTTSPLRFYIRPSMQYVDYLEINNLSLRTLKDVMVTLGYHPNNVFFYSWNTNHDLDWGLIRLQTEKVEFKSVLPKLFEESPGKNIKKLILQLV